MSKYKVGDIFINHNDGKILKVYEGECGAGCRYGFIDCKGIFGSINCRRLIGCNTCVKELPSLPPGTKVKVREDLKVDVKYGQYLFVENMKPYKEVTIKQYNVKYKIYTIIEDWYSYTIEMFDQVINEPKENNNMETKEIKIKVPEGYEIDKENSTFSCIKFKPSKKELTYKDVAEYLFSDTCYFTNKRGEIVSTEVLATKEDKNNATSKEQLERLLALNQLLNIAEYYNKKNPKKEGIYGIELDERNSRYFTVERSSLFVYGLIPMFNREEDAKAVIENPNFKAILDILFKD